MISKKTANPRTKTPGLDVDEITSLENQIARRGHELWQERGHRHGHDLHDWLQAEREITEWHHRRRKKDSNP